MLICVFLTEFSPEGDSGEADGEAEDGDDAPDEDGDVPIVTRHFGDHGEAGDGDGRAAVGAGVKYAGEGGHLTGLDEPLGNNGDEHKVDAVHTSDDQGHGHDSHHDIGDQGIEGEKDEGANRRATQKRNAQAFVAETYGKKVS